MCGNINQDSQEFLQFEASPTPRKFKKPRAKITRMNFLYKTAVVLFIIAIGFLIAAMVICITEDNPDHESALSMIFSWVSAGTAFLGIIFTLLSRRKAG